MSKFNKINSLFAVVLVGALVLPSCTFRPTYNRKSLTGLNSGSADYTETIDGVTVLIRKLTVSDCKEAFDGRSFNDPKNSILPMHITIRNSSDQSVVLKKRNITLALLDNEEVSKALHYNTAGRSVAAALLPGGIFAGAVYGSLSKGGNANVDLDIEKKSAETSMVDAGDIVNTLIFVDEDGYKKHFNISLQTVGSHKKVIDFKVAL